MAKIIRVNAVSKPWRPTVVVEDAAAVISSNCCFGKFVTDDPIRGAGLQIALHTHKTHDFHVVLSVAEVKKAAQLLGLLPVT